MTLPPQIAYLSFDTVPAPKGAAIHIAAFAQTLAQSFGGVHLITVSPETTAQYQERWPAVYHRAFPALGKTLIDRVLSFRHELTHWLQEQRFQVIQIRSIYEGWPIARQKSRYCDFLVFEVNGLPSIELKYRYPQVADDRELMHKLLAQEQQCLEAADLVITPSPITATFLQTRGVPPHKVRVIPNGVDLGIFQYQSPTQGSLNPFRLLYFGTLAGWQGVSLAIEAVGLYNRDFPASLTIVGPNRPAQVTALYQLAEKLQIADRVQVLEPMSQALLVQQMHAVDAIVAPLTANDRNLVQGCCPLKVLEAMASGTPVIATDLPVVRALGTSETHFLLVKPGSAKAIKDAMCRLTLDSALRNQLSQAARHQVETHYTWHRAGESLTAVYESLGIKRAITA